MSSAPTPLGAVARGLAAGAIGTGVMTAVQTLPAKLQDDQAGEEEASPAPQDPWQQASAPAKLGRRISEGVLERPVPPERIGLLTNVMHWGYGTGWGAVYGLVQGTVGGRPLRHGLLFGTGVWLMAYVQLVPIGLSELPWKYSPKDLGTELGFHLAYGAGVASGYRVLAGR